MIPPKDENRASEARSPSKPRRPPGRPRKTPLPPEPPPEPVCNWTLRVVAPASRMLELKKIVIVAVLSAGFDLPGAVDSFLESSP